MSSMPSAASMEPQGRPAEPKPNVFGSKKWSSFHNMRNKKGVKAVSVSKENLFLMKMKRNQRSDGVNCSTNGIDGITEGVVDPNIQEGHLANYQLPANYQLIPSSVNNIASMNNSSLEADEVVSDSYKGSVGNRAIYGAENNLGTFDQSRGAQETMTRAISSSLDITLSKIATPDCRKSSPSEEDLVQENSYTEEPSSDFTTSDSFLNISVDSEYGEIQHPFDESFDFSVSSDEEDDEDDHEDEQVEELDDDKETNEKDGDSGSNQNQITKMDAANTNMEPAIHVETLYSSGDNETESTTSLSTEGSRTPAGSADDDRNKAPASPPATATAPAAPRATTSPTTTSTTNFYIPRAARQEQQQCHLQQQQQQQQQQQRTYQSAATSRISDTPSSFRSKRFQEYLLTSFHNNHNDQEDPEYQSWIELPPAGTVDDLFQSVLDRPFRHWKAVDEALEYSHPEWLTHQRGRMIHHLIHFLELKIGFQDYAVDAPKHSSSSSSTIRSGGGGSGGRLMPSPVVDEAWRALILESALYEKVTRDLQEFHGEPSYQYIHYSRVKTMKRHSSFLGPRGGRIIIPEELSMTQSLFQIYFREFMPASIRQVRTTPASIRIPSSSSSATSSPSSSPQQATTRKTRLSISTTTSTQRNNNGGNHHHHHWKPSNNNKEDLNQQMLVGASAHPLLDTKNRRSSDGNLRGLECLNGTLSEEFSAPSPSPLASITSKKHVMWC